jgi:hypothetical protein
MTRRSKPFWKSKTFWANIALITGAIVDARRQPTGELSIIVSAIATLNIVLRVLTDQPLTLTSKR